MPRARIINFKDKQYTFKQLAHKYNISPSTLRNRYYDGFRGNDLIKKPQNKIRNVIINGKKHTFAKLSRKYHIDKKTIMCRYDNGDREFALIRPVKEQKSYTHKKTKIKMNDKYYSFQELGRIYGLKTDIIRRRYHKGYRGKDLVQDINFRFSDIVINGKHRTIKQISKEYDIPYGTIFDRYTHGKRGKDLISK